METMTTISISTELRDKIKEFGQKGDSYDTILNKWYESAVKTQLSNILFDESDSISIEEALNNSKNKWSE